MSGLITRAVSAKICFELPLPLLTAIETLSEEVRPPSSVKRRSFVRSLAYRGRRVLGLLRDDVVLTHRLQLFDVLGVEQTVWYGMVRF